MLQSVLKWGDAEQKAALAAELLPCLPALAKDAYATHLVRRLVDGAPPPLLASCVKAFVGHAAASARHPFAAPALDAVYCAASPPQRAQLLAEFYGPARAAAANAARAAAAAADALGDESAPAYAPLFLQHAPPLSLADIPLDKASLSKLASRLAPILEKGLVSFAHVHRLLTDFLPALSPSGLADTANQLTGAAVLRMIHTPEGCRAGARLLGAASARERKAAVKALKGRVADVAKDSCGHVALLSLLGATDDTSLLRKGLLAELLPGLDGLLTHKHGRKVVLNLLRPGSLRYLSPAVVASLPEGAGGPCCGHPPGHAHSHGDTAADGNGDGDGGGGDGDGDAAPPPESGAAAAAPDDSDTDDDEHGIGATPGAAAASLKPTPVRRAELLAFLGPPLVSSVTRAAPSLLTHPLGCDVLLEVALGVGVGGNEVQWRDASSPLRRSIDDAAATALVDAIVAAAAGGGGEGAMEAAAAEVAAEGSAGAGGGAPASTPVSDSFFATRTLRRLARESPGWAGELWRRVVSPRAQAWATGPHSAKVVAAIVAASPATGDDDGGVAEASGEAAAAVRAHLGVADAAAWAATFAFHDTALGDGDGEAAEHQHANGTAAPRRAVAASARRGGAKAAADAEAPPAARVKRGGGAVAAKAAAAGAAAAAAETVGAPAAKKARTPAVTPAKAAAAAKTPAKAASARKTPAKR